MERYSPLTREKINRRGGSIKKGKSSQKTALRIKTESYGHDGFIKIVITALLVLLQMLALFALFFWLSDAFWGYLIFAFIASFISALHVLSTNKSGQNKAVWICFLLFLFFVSYLIYIVSYVEPFYGRSREKYAKIYERTRQYEQTEDIHFSDPRLESDKRIFQGLGNFPVSKGDLQYFSSGSNLFADLFEKIEKAEKFIFLEFFIVADGILLHNLSEILIEKAKAGVDVRFIYDDMGPRGQFSRRMKKKLSESGVKLYPFNRLLPLFSLSLNYRDHRKIVIIDGEVAYTGGFNLADEYVNAKLMYGYWKDSGIRVTGQAVDNFTLLFLRQWEYLNEKEEDYSPYLGCYEREGDKDLIVYADGLDYRENVGRSAYINLITKAEGRLYIMVPYFLPDETIENLLIEKARSGVDVRIVLPDIPDKPYVYLLTRNYAEKLTEYGVKVYTVKDSFVHAKVVLTDYAGVVGSINIDSRSFYEESEVAVYITDEETKRSVEEDFERCFARSEQIFDREQSLFDRVLTGFLRLFAPLM